MRAGRVKGKVGGIKYRVFQNPDIPERDGIEPLKSHLQRSAKKLLITWFEVDWRSSLDCDFLGQFKNELTKKEPVFPSAPLCELMDSLDFGP